MKIVVLLFIGAATMLITAGCESEEHEHHEHHGGAYDNNYGGYGHEQWPGYPARQGYWDRSDDWHPH
jgi:hypothetical protein